MKTNKRLRVVFSSYDDVTNPYYAGGGARAIHEVAKNMRQDFDIRVISWNHSGKSHEKIDGVTYRRIGFSFIPPRVGMFLFQLLLPLFCLTQSFDVWIESFGPPFTTSFLPWFTRKPVVGVVHMLASAEIKRKYGIDLSSLENLGISQYSKIIATQPAMQKEIMRINPQVVCSVIENGVNLPTISRKEKNTILFLGRIEMNQKGIDLLLKIFSLLPVKFQQRYTLAIAGSGLKKEEEKLKKAIAAVNKHGSIQFLGRVEGTKKETLLAESLCMMITSRFETYSMVALEALISGLPVLCFDIPGLQWMPENGVKKIPSFDTKKFSSSLRLLLEDTQSRKRMSTAGRAYAKTRTWDHVADAYISYIHKQFSV